MESATPAPYVVEDCGPNLQLFSDGTVVRFDDYNILPPLHDLLRDRDVDYAARLRATGKRVELVEFEGQHHGFFAAEPFGDAGSELVRVVSRFVYGNAAASNY
uniref:Alpha/beta hydrolase fold-3 domain-containing protein n=1 Tax=Oryza brachyantha TaxID=4533 RepID=J3LTK1_ORYBR